MDEIAVYITRGNDADKDALESLGAAASIQSAGHYISFRNAECPRFGAALSGFGPGERLFVASPNRALVSSYVWGKESVDQRFPVLEQLSCLVTVKYSAVNQAQSPTHDEKETVFEQTAYMTPWLLIGGSKTGRLYIWELALGDLVCVKDAHYQEIASMSVSTCGTFLVSGGLDARVHVWDVMSLVTPSLLTGCKPYATFSNHSLPVTQVEIYSLSMVSDYRVYSSSRDATVCIYDVLKKSLLTTFVLPSPVECFARDPAGRALFAGLADGTVRQVSFYVVNSHTRVLEAVGGTGKVVTVEADPELQNTFVHHLLTANGSTATAARDASAPPATCYPTVMRVSMDGMQLVSGDSYGQTFVADVVTKQVVKAFTPCKSPIMYLAVRVCDKSVLSSQGFSEKKHRLLPPLKRVLVSAEPLKHTLSMQLHGAVSQEESFSDWLERKALEEFRLLSADAAEVYAGTEIHGSEATDLRKKLDKVSVAYTDLKTQYEELLAARDGLAPRAG